MFCEFKAGKLVKIPEITYDRKRGGKCPFRAFTLKKYKVKYGKIRQYI